MHHGTPETRLWAAVVLTLINDCRDELATVTDIESIERGSRLWQLRACEPSFLDVLDIVEIDVAKVIRWIKDFEQRAKTAFHLGGWENADLFLADDRAVIGRGQKRVY